MGRNEFNFKSEVDGLQISCLSVTPDSEPKAIIVMAHGVMEYKERYEPLMSFFADNGFACYISDHRGYGKSVKTAEDNGFTYGAGANGMLSDMHTLMGAAKREYPAKKVFLYAHSMGALCAMCFIKRWGRELSGVILSGLPAFIPAVGLGEKYVKVKKLVKGARFRDPAVSKLMFDNFSSKFAGEESKYCWINSNLDEVRKYEEDPLCGQMITLDGCQAVLDLMMEAYDRKKPVNASEMLPIYIAAGEYDVCAGGVKGMESGIQYLKALGFVRAGGKSYTGMRHEIHNEPRKNEVFTDYLNKLISWM